MKKVILIAAMALFSFNSMADDSKSSVECAYRAAAKRNASTNPVKKNSTPVTETQEARQIVR